MKKHSKLIITTALFAAITYVLTFTVRFPTALGYVHPGDSMIYLAACILPFPYALIAAALGGGLSDLLAGYPHWILPTMIIKALITLPFSYKTEKILTKRNAFMVIPAGLISIAGYFVASWIMYGWAGAVLGLSGDFMQSVISAVIFIIFANTLDKIGFKHKYYISNL